MTDIILETKEYTIQKKAFGKEQTNCYIITDKEAQIGRASCRERV